MTAIQIVENRDDGTRFRAFGGGLVYNGTFCIIGYNTVALSKAGVGLLFQNIPIAQGTIIPLATLTRFIGDDMSYADVTLHVDLSAIEQRLDGIEVAGTFVIPALVMCLKEKRMKDMRLIATKQDGDELINEDGIVVIWDATIRSAVQAEVTETNRLIAALS